MPEERGSGRLRETTAKRFLTIMCGAAVLYEASQSVQIDSRNTTNDISSVKLRFLPQVIVQSLKQGQYQMRGGTLYATTYSEESTLQSPSSYQKRNTVYPIPEKRQDTTHKNGEGPIYVFRDRFQPLPWYGSSFLGRITARRKDIDRGMDEFGGTSKVSLHVPSIA